MCFRLPARRVARVCYAEEALVAQFWFNDAKAIFVGIQWSPPIYNLITKAAGG
jgi:hypothetical protein